MFLAAQLLLGCFVFSRESNSQFDMEVQWSHLWMLGFYWTLLLSRGVWHIAEILSGTWPTKSCQKRRRIADEKSWPSGPVMGISSWQGPQVSEFEGICTFPASMPVCYGDLDGSLGGLHRLPQIGAGCLWQHHRGLVSARFISRGAGPELAAPLHGVRLGCRKAFHTKVSAWVLL